MCFIFVCDFFLGGRASDIWMCVCVCVCVCVLQRDRGIFVSHMRHVYLCV